MQFKFSATKPVEKVILETQGDNPSLSNHILQIVKAGLRKKYPTKKIK